MKDYLLLFRGGDDELAAGSPELNQAHMQQWMEWMSQLSANNQLGGAEPLKMDGRLISGRQKLVTDGPFMEGKEMVGGYLLLKAGSYDEAVEIAKACPILELTDTSVEVREIQVMDM
jgi:hypothetical protein